MASEWAKKKCGCGHCHGGLERLNCWADELDAARVLGQEEIQKQITGELQRLWENEHRKNPDDRIGDGSPDVINACIAAIGLIKQNAICECGHPNREHDKFGCLHASCRGKPCDPEYSEAYHA